MRGRAILALVGLCTMLAFANKNNQEQAEEPEFFIGKVDTNWGVNDPSNGDPLDTESVKEIMQSFGANIPEADREMADEIMKEMVTGMIFFVFVFVQFS